ncbi:hypothetical protein CW706_02955 [Candidatus Bathyarchaeota archaeon]|nr:MAG: hypothetical protein CW706_02955 [Candidatus Bathyarchaeota archaeon]
MRLIASLADAVNPKVDGSSPSGGATFFTSEFALKYSERYNYEMSSRKDSIYDYEGWMKRYRRILKGLRIFT